MPSASPEPEPEKALKEYGDRTRKFDLSPSNILDTIHKRVIERPSDIGRITKEIFEITEHALIYTPIYEVRCRHLKKGEIRIIPISGVTDKMLSP